VPELPDLTVIAEAFNAALAGRPLRSVVTPSALTVRGTPGEIRDLSGQHVVAIARRGKFLVLTLERDLILVNPMLSGRFQLARPDVKLPTRTALILAFGGRREAALGQASWTLGAPWLPPDASGPEVRYRDPTQMGKVYILPAGVERSVPGWGPPDQGPDADDPDMTVDAWRSRIRRHPGELKNLLRNQSFVAGIGNAYSDEVLHAARLHPFRKRSSLAAEEVDELYAAVRTTLARAVEILRVRVPPTFETQVRDFLAVHLKGGQPCPRCGARISQISPGGIATSYCRNCQR
jgi:formamidopyrimidine-DNA glycosylase